MPASLPYVRILSAMTLVALAAALPYPLFEIGDTAVVGRVFAWGVVGLWDGASRGRFVNPLEAIQALLVIAGAAAALGCLLLGNAPRWLTLAMAIVVTLIPVATWWQASRLAPNPADVLPILNGAFALLVGAVMFSTGAAFGQLVQGSRPR